MSPSNRTNPVTTSDSGAFGWDALAGWYEVEASKPGCVSPDGAGSSGPLNIPPPVTELKLVLDCSPPDTTPPTVNIAGVEPFAKTPTVTANVTVTDVNAAAALCAVDGGPLIDSDGEVADPGATDSPTLGMPDCGSTFTTPTLSDGQHSISAVALDDHSNMTVNTVQFTVDTIAPTLQVTGVEPGRIYEQSAQPTPGCSASDSGSGLSAPCTGKVTQPPSGIGTWTYQADATDKAGNAATTSVSWTVAARTMTSPMLDGMGTGSGTSSASTTLTTARPGDLLLAFVSADGPEASQQKVATITGGGLAWKLVTRAGQEAGAAEVWQAHASSTFKGKVTATMTKGGFDAAITVSGFNGAADSVVAAAGAAGRSTHPEVRLTAQKAGSLVWAVGHDWDRSKARAADQGQVIVSQLVAKRIHDTFWTQRLVDPVVTAKTITVGTSAPAKDRWQVAAVEIPAK